MYETISLSGMSREEWLDLRKGGIGGSDAGAVCGLNPYSSAMKVYLDKTGGTVENADNEAMRQGRDLEDYVAGRFTEATGLKVRRSNRMYVSREHPFMFADVDRLIAGEDAGLECKTVSAYGAGKWENGAVPAHYLLQCYHYMAVTGKRSWYIAAVILGQGFCWKKIDWDDIIIESMILLEEDFWNNHVVPRKIPDPDGSKACDEVLEQYFHVSRKGDAVALTGFDWRLERRQELSDQIKMLEQEQKKIEQEIKFYMGEHELAYSDRYQVSWVNINTSRLDTARLKADRPEVYQEFLKPGSSRKFTVKERLEPAEAVGEAVGPAETEMAEPAGETAAGTDRNAGRAA